MKNFAIIVAGGTGTRMNTGIPKQFIPLGGVPVLSYSISAFHHQDPATEIIVALPEGFADQWKTLVQETRLDIPHRLVQGGSERFYSVLNALNTIHHAEGLVAVHDAARPFVSPQLIEKAFAEAARLGSAVPAVNVKDSLRVKVLDAWVVADRNHFKAVQTPQVFQLAPLKSAYQQSYQHGFTDDASVFEKAGNRIHILDGEEANFKITTQADLDFAEWLYR